MIRLKHLITEASEASKKAKQLGLRYAGFGRYTRNGKVVAKTEQGKLVMLKGEKPDSDFVRGAKARTAVQQAVRKDYPEPVRPPEPEAIKNFVFPEFGNEQEFTDFHKTPEYQQHFKNVEAWHKTPEWQEYVRASTEWNARVQERLDQNRIKEIAETHDYPAELIHVERGPLGDFMLNGVKHERGGYFDPLTGHIVLAPNCTGAGIAAHEVMHGKFHRVLDEYNREYRALRERAEAEYPKGPLTAADTLKPGYEAEYPTYAALSPYLIGYENKKTGRWVDGPRTLQEEDGVSAYSRDYWQAYQTGKEMPGEGYYHGYFTPINETLAEIANDDYSGAMPDLLAYRNKSRKHLMGLYKAIRKHYKRLGPPPIKPQRKVPLDKT